jgi:hypothetical protein
MRTKLTRNGKSPRLRNAPVAIGLALALLLATEKTSHAQWLFTTNNGAITITGYTGTNEAVAIPSIINGLPVTGVADYAFEDGLIARASIPASVAQIGAAPFSGCANLTEIMVDPLNPAYQSVDGVLLGGGNTVLVEYPPARPASSYAIPISVTSIGADAFFACASLTSVTLPSGLANIGSVAFVFCDGLTSVTIPDTVTNLSYGAFKFCASLTNVVIPGGVTAIAAETFRGAPLASVAIPDSVTSVGDAAFNGTKLTSVAIPSRVASIGFQAFADCASLTNAVVASARRVDVGREAFAGCPSLAGVYFRGDAPILGAGLGFDQFAGDTNATASICRARPAGAIPLADFPPRRGSRKSRPAVPALAS